ncbi:unnamed protein product [Meganyctiphanes norvegica]|uniref:Protein quiver n=1 Tax=Meganyctiphanes norvegica TaxID=48144 RepID=A0AAV2PYS7_MEGNR
MTYTLHITAAALVLSNLLARTSCDINCYSCQNFNNELADFDPFCGGEGYNNQTHECVDCSSCVTRVYDGGVKVSRDWTYGDHEEGKCVFYEDHVRCFCNSDLCNDYRCANCFPNTTVTPRPTTTSTTPQPVLQCYMCIGCSNVDENTPQCEDVSFKSCTTIVNMDSAMVSRTCSKEKHTDGECITDEHGLIHCYCEQNLCNGHSVGPSS